MIIPLGTYYLTTRHIGKVLSDFLQEEERKVSESVVQSRNFRLLILHLDFSDFSFFSCPLLFTCTFRFSFSEGTSQFGPRTAMFSFARLVFPVPSFCLPHTQARDVGRAGPGARQEKGFTTLSSLVAWKLRKKWKRDVAGYQAEAGLNGYGGDHRKTAETITQQLGTPGRPCSVLLYFTMLQDFHFQQTRTWIPYRSWTYSNWETGTDFYFFLM